MIFNYSSRDFENLKSRLIEIFTLHQQDEKYKNLIGIFLKCLTDDFDKLKYLDNSAFIFNNWKDVNNAINANLLSEENVELYNFKASREVNTFNFENIFNSFYLTLYADIYEASITYDENIFDSFYNNLQRSLQLNSNKVSEYSFDKLSRLWYLIPKTIFDKYIKNHINQEIIDTVKTISSSQNYINQKINETNTLKSDVNTIKQALEQQKTEFNFIGLSDGFNSLRKQKVKELNGERRVYWILMLSIIGLIIYKLYWTVNYLNEPNPNLQLLIVVSISFVLMLLVVIYFFRISLVNIKSIRSQILQIDLRLTLCQFIHNYQNDTSGFRNAEIKDSLDKFEAVIFSPIVATDDKIPTTFEGIEQLSGLIGLVKGKTP
jgi:ABC-type multidrug transport system fused ATPase/permease subunit